MLTASAVLVSWTYFLVKTVVTFRTYPPLRPPDEWTGKTFPFVSILIPARNEEVNIAACLDSLLELDYPNYEIIAVDDRSGDGTLSILESYQKKDPRVRALHLDKSSEGWSGKNYALHRGVELARGEWFLFTDADTFHYPESLRIGLGHALENRVGFLTLLSRLDCRTFFEKLIQPIAGGLMVLWYPLEKLNDPRSSLGFANGQYILMDRGTYETLGGHGSVKEKLLEDVALAERAKEMGVPFKISIGVNALQTRMYRGFKNSWNGWKRIFLHLAERNPFEITLTTIGFFGLGVLPALLVILGSSGDFHPLFLPLSLAGLGLSIGVRWTLNHLSRVPRWPALIYPLGSLLVFGILVEVLFESLVNKKTHWRGQHY